MAEGAGFFGVAGQKLLPYGGPGQDSLFFRKVPQRFREVAADLFCRGDSDFVGKARRDVGFVYDDRDTAQLRRQNDGYGYEAAF